MRQYLVTAVLAALAVPVLAQTAAPVAPPARPMADKVMTRAEADARVRAHFAQADSNRDGFVTAEEMSARRGARMAGRQERKQRRAGNEPMRDPAAAFDRLDTNRDGMINREEFARGREVRIEKRVVMNGAPGPHGAMRGMHGGRGGMMGAAMLKMADANNDGRVSLQEASSGALRHFDMIDTNRDGRITQDERRAGRGMMRQMRTRRAT